jgi:hypothetical protein
MCLIALPSFVFAQSAKDAVRALKKLEARCQAGISYRDYGPALGDAKFEVNLFRDSREAAVSPELALRVEKAMIHYEDAATAWRQKFHSWNHFGMLKADETVAKIMLENYPVMNKQRGEGGAMYPRKDGVADYLDIDDMVKVIWTEAGGELKKAMILLQETQAAGR